MLLSFCRIILFFNPFARLFQRAIAGEMEHICDDGVIKLGYCRWKYSHALYTLASERSATIALALAATGGQQVLVARVRRILNVAADNKSRKKVRADIARPALLFFLCLTVGIFLGKPQLDHRRQKAIARTPVPSKIVEQVVYRKEVTIEKTTSAFAPGRQVVQLIRKNRHNAMMAVEQRGAALARMGLVLANVHPPGEEPVSFFVSKDDETPQFTLVIPEPPAPPFINPGIGEALPYVAPTTFYYSNVEDSLKSRKLRVVHF